MLEGIPRLIARLHPDHRKLQFLKDSLYRISAGYSGECNVDTYIERTQITHLTKIFTDVHLRISPTFTFQIDTLIITERYVLIVEVKNLKDTVRFVQNPPHLEQIFETGTEAILDCPIHQIESNKSNLDEWFRQRGIHLKTSGLLVLANQKTKVKDAPSDLPIIYKKQIPFYLQKLQPAETILSTAQIHDLAREIHAEKQHFNPFPLCAYYNIDHRELKTGLLCRYCNRQLQRENREKWSCELCGKNTVNPYSDGIKDWFMLVKNSITNEECRSFLKLKGSNAARYILSKSGLVKKGRSKATFYISSNRKQR